MTRSLALVALGLWLGLLLASWAMASASFRTVDRVLGPGGREEAAARLAPVAAPDRRLVLRHLASELNRWMFAAASLAQLGVAAAVIAAAWGGGGRLRFLALAAFAIVLVQLAGLAPAIADLGRSLDFVPRPLPPELGRRFGLLHAAYVGLDFVKAAIVAIMAVTLARRA